MTSHSHTHRVHPGGSDRGMCSVEEGVRHEGEYSVQRNSAHKRKPVYVPDIHFSAKEQKETEEQEKKDRAEEVGVVHYVLIDPGEGVEHSESLNFDVPEIYTQLLQ